MARKFSILHVCAPAQVGGLERVVGSLAAGQRARGHAVTVAAVLDKGARVPPAIADAEAAGVDLVPLRFPPRAYAAERHAVRRLAISLGADILHTHGYRADVVAGPVAAKARCARVSTAHGFTGGGVKNRAYEWMQRRALRRCDAVAAVSEPLAARLRRAGVDAVRTIPTGTPLATEGEPPRRLRARLGVPEAALHVGWIGRLSPEKGPDVFLEALAALRPDLKWFATIVGGGAMRHSLGTLSERLGVANRARFLGRVDRAAALLPSFDVLVMSSRSEGTPIVLIEAIEAGTPVIATRVGGVEAAAGRDGALFVEAEDPHGLARAIEAVAADADGAAARAASARRHRAQVPDWLSAYEDLYAFALEARGIAHARTAAASSAPEPSTTAAPHTDTAMSAAESL